MVPKSYPNLPAGFVERMFHAITASEIRAPITRNIRKCDFDLEMFQQEIKHRLVKASTNEQAKLSVEEFLSTSDLAKDQLFDKNNKTVGFIPDDLVSAALANIVNMLSARSLTISRGLQ